MTNAATRLPGPGVYGIILSPEKVGVRYRVRVCVSGYQLCY